ncbi:MAG TPA: cupredoxin domain-containing protein [Acidobacteriaceae bacterium]
MSLAQSFGCVAPAVASDFDACPFHRSNAKEEIMKKRFMLLVALAGVLSAGAALVRSTPAQDAPKRVEIVSKKFAFEPGEITLKKGQPVILVLKSEDVAHGLRFRELNFDIKVDKGGTGEAKFTPDKTGDFVGHCSVFCGAGHGSMTLKLHVVD